MTSLELAVTVQLALYALAIVTALVTLVRFVRLQRRATSQPDGASWWQTAEARQATRHALRPLWITTAALVLGAFAPRLLGAL